MLQSGGVRGGSGVCNQLFINRYMWPEGPWQRLAAALAGSRWALPAQILPRSK